MSAYEDITALLYRYCTFMDAGDFAGASQLFARAQVRLPAVKDMPGTGMYDLWRHMIILYPCGTPRTQHMVTNPIVEVDRCGTVAHCHARYMVLQQTDDLPLQIIAAGHYEDRFACDATGGHVTFRDYSHLKFSGNLNHHLRTSPVSSMSRDEKGK